jgi:uncharacterized protein (UPF0371 family)
MGVNMAGNCIFDDDACKEASNQEIIRRYFASNSRLMEGSGTEEEVYKIQLLMNQADIRPEDRRVVPVAMELEKETKAPTAALELPHGRIVTGKTSDLLGASAALLLNALKVLADIPHDIHLVSPAAIEPIQALKTKYLGSHNPRLHTDEVLIALSISAANDPNARKAMEQLPKLKGCQVHTSVLLSSVDRGEFRRLGMELTSWPKYENKRLYN